MTPLTLDAATSAQLHNLSGVVEVKDETGRVLGVFYPAVPAEKWRSPHTREELEEMRKQRSGRPLADILKDLQAR